MLIKIINIDKQDNDGKTALIRAAQEGYVEIVKHLIEAGVNLDTKDNYETTALIWAVINGYVEIVKYMVEAGTGINIQDKEGKTAIHWAIEKGCKDIEKELMITTKSMDALYKEKYKEYLVKTQKII